MADLKNRILKSFLSFKCLRKESVTELPFEDKAHTEPNTPSQRQEKKIPRRYSKHPLCCRYTHVSHTHSLPKGKKHREANMYKQHTHTQSITMKPLMGGPRVGTLTAVVH